MCMCIDCIRNDGVWDRVEIFNLFAMDPDNTTFEEYTFKLASARFQPGGITGNYPFTVRLLISQVMHIKLL